MAAQSMKQAPQRYCIVEAVPLPAKAVHRFHTPTASWATASQR